MLTIMKSLAKVCSSCKKAAATGIAGLCIACAALEGGSVSHAGDAMPKPAATIKMISATELWAPTENQGDPLHTEIYGELSNEVDLVASSSVSTARTPERSEYLRMPRL